MSKSATFYLSQLLEIQNKIEELYDVIEEDREGYSESPKNFDYKSERCLKGALDQIKDAIAEQGEFNKHN